ncbi:hypothetical protein ACSYDW_00695 [Paeniglutamicibacter sp. R2-26]|uniref:hypothetical protein n=1 Tax=Paeniglutamicibacter sp. R2-26 TaxID=3144417 RepID=UPI003EE79592
MGEPTDSAKPPRRAPGVKLATVVAVIAVLSAAAGIATLWIGSGEVVSFGWMAYAPLDDGEFLPGMYLLGPKEVTGWALVAIGIAGAAFLAGLSVGKRSH